MDILLKYTEYLKRLYPTKAVIDYNENFNNNNQNLKKIYLRTDGSIIQNTVGGSKNNNNIIIVL